jgi:nucleoid-associated protein YgaU
MVSPGLLTAPGVRSIGDAGTEASAVTVLAGDTLWDIAAFAMGPEATDVDIALAWPRWYEANRSVIGQNPDVLLPGQILQPPSAA